MVLRAIHLCAGYGGFELALRGVARTVAHVERDAYAAATLVARMEGQELDRAPIWSDLCTFDAGPWRGRVDLITAGFPCQPFSAAGKRAGTDDDRWLWPEISRIIADVEPRFVFLENVPRLVRYGLPEVLYDLAALGFDAEWGLLSAAAVGAPHKRERFWLVGRHRDPPDTDRDGLALVGRESEHDRDTRHDTDGSGGANVADTEGPRSAVADRASRSGTQLPEVARFRGFPPRPGDTIDWAEWTATGGAQPSVRRGVDGTPEWLADALHLGGNGLVPQCAREAWGQLTERLER